MLSRHLLSLCLLAATVRARVFQRDTSVVYGDDCSPEQFTQLLPSSGSVVWAQRVPANGTFVDPSVGGNGGGPTTVYGLQALCVVKFTVPTSNRSQVDFALFLPDQWNERFMTSGNGGYSGQIAWDELAAFSYHGFATLSTNTGHYATILESSWAANNTEAQADWGYRAIHLTVELSKRIINGYYGRSAHHNYFASCSNGGRQGLKELTEYPEDFDGVITGAPAWALTQLFTWINEFQLPSSNAPLEDRLSDGLLSTFAQEAIRQCDPQDGLVDGIVSDPYGCNFIPETLLCNSTTPVNTTTCFSSSQLKLLRHTLSDWIDVNQTFVHPTLALGSDYAFLHNLAAIPFGLGYLQNFVYNSTGYGSSDFVYYQTVQEGLALNPGNTNVNYDVDEFHARGGKLLMYHGLADQLIPPRDSIHWYNHVQTALEEKGLVTDDWLRLFLFPGMAHCISSNQDAPWYIGAGQQSVALQGARSVPGFEDAQHDVVLAMVEWVERGVAPQQLIATRYNGDVFADGVQKQRPACPYPQQAVYLGEGHVDRADSWRCEYTVPAQAELYE
jgi:feruloyl esterase